MTRTAASILIALLLPLHAGALEKIIWNLAEHQPNIAQGGRANAVAVHPSNAGEMLVASNGGGLFQSTDGGLRWTHVDELPVYSTQAVAYMASGVVLVSAKADFRKHNGGGVWRRAAGETTWTQVPLNTNGRLSAYEISLVYASGPAGVRLGTIPSGSGRRSVPPWGASGPSESGSSTQIFMKARKKSVNK